MIIYVGPLNFGTKIYTSVPHAFISCHVTQRLVKFNSNFFFRSFYSSQFCIFTKWNSICAWIGFRYLRCARFPELLLGLNVKKTVQRHDIVNLCQVMVCNFGKNTTQLLFGSRPQLSWWLCQLCLKSANLHIIQRKSYQDDAPTFSLFFSFFLFCDNYLERHAVVPYVLSGVCKLLSDVCVTT